MNCPKCSVQLPTNVAACPMCGASDLSAAALPRSTTAEKLKSLPAALVLSLMLAHFVKYVDLNYSTTNALARSIGVNLIPIAFFVAFVLFGQRKMKITTTLISILFIFLLVVSTLQDAKDRLQ
jgi:hypothetical protein